MALSPDPVLSFPTYEAFLDSRVTEKDIFYLGDRDIARELAELGFSEAGDIELLTRQEFASRKAAAAEELATLRRAPKRLASAGLPFSPKSDCPLLQALAAREDEVLRGKLATVIFLRALTPAGHEISGYIDYLHRLQQEGVMEAVFQGRAHLLPNPRDLSSYNHSTKTHSSNASSSFHVIADTARGLLFKHTTDSKVISIAPGCSAGDDCSRTVLPVLDSSDYLQAILFDHHVRHH